MGESFQPRDQLRAKQIQVTMAHVRTQIRNAVKTILTGLPTTGNRVFVSRVYPLEKADLPGIIIFTEQDETDNSQAAINNGSLILWSQLHTVVKAYAKGTAQVHNTLDQIALEVRKVLLTNQNLGGLTENINWQSTLIQIEIGAEQPVGTAEILFVIYYRIKENLLETPLT